MQPPEGRWKVDTQASLWLLVALRQHGLRVIDLAENPQGVLVKQLAFFGQTHAAGRAMHQTRRQRLLQPREALAHRRPRHAKPFGSLGKARCVRHTHKGQYITEMIDHCFQIVPSVATTAFFIEFSDRVNRGTYRQPSRVLKDHNPMQHNQSSPLTLRHRGWPAVHAVALAILLW